MAQKDMVRWLSDPHELGKTPTKIELAGEFFQPLVANSMGICFQCSRYLERTK